MKDNFLEQQDRPTPNLLQRIIKVMSAIEHLKKDDEVNTGKGSYKAITEEKVTSTVRTEMIKNGITILPIKIEHLRHDTIVKDKYGNEKVHQLTTANVTYLMSNADNATDSIEVVSSGTGVDTQDKGIGKALTYAYKYLLLRSFAIPTGEDPDKISSDTLDEEYKRVPETLTASQFGELEMLFNSSLFKNDEAQRSKLENIGPEGFDKAKKQLLENQIDRIESGETYSAKDIQKKLDEKGT